MDAWYAERAADVKQATCLQLEVLGVFVLTPNIYMKERFKVSGRWCFEIQ